MASLDIAIVAPALPAIQTSHPAVSTRHLTWVFTIYVLFTLVGTPLMAKLSDALGRRPIYLLEVSLFMVGSLVVAISPSFGVLVAGRAIEGLGAGGIFPVAGAVIGDTFPLGKRGRALGLIGAVFGLAFLLGPLLGGIILALATWRWLFLINLPIAIAVLILAARILPSTHLAERKPFDYVGMIVLALSLGSLTFGITHIDTSNFVQSFASLDVWPFLVGTVVLLVVFWYVEHRVVDPILQLRLFRSRQIRVISGLAVGAGFGEASVVFVPSLLVAAFGISESAASFALLPAVLSMAIASPFSGRLLDRFGSRIVILAASALFALGMLVIGLLPITWVVFYVAAALVGLGLGMLVTAPLSYVMLNETPAEDRTAGQGALTVFTSSGQLIGGALVGAVAASLGGGVLGYQGSYLAVSAVAVVLILLSLGLKNRTAELASLRRPERKGQTQIA